jgi:hypothetical protein
MENDNLNKLWKTQGNDILKYSPQDVITKAKKQRNGQYLTITILSTTVIIIVIYAFSFALNRWNAFNLGLILMASSLTLRIILEFYSMYRNERHLISMDHKSYHIYLKKYYRIRLMVNYIVTPVCIVLYIVGYTLLLPTFEKYFSKVFYSYILLFGIISLFIIVAIIIYSISKEQRFLRHLNKI